MPYAPYTTSVYPYPAEMWDEAADYLTTHRGWMAVLITCPDPPAARETAIQEMTNRGIENTRSIVYLERFAECHSIRISRLEHLHPRWDELESRLISRGNVALIIIKAATARAALALIDDTRAAMQERGIRVTVGYSEDPDSGEGLLRIEKV